MFQRHAVRVSLPTLTLGAVIFKVALCWSHGPVAAVITIVMIIITSGGLTAWSFFAGILSSRVSMGHLNSIEVKLFCQLESIGHQSRV